MEERIGRDKQWAKWVAACCAAQQYPFLIRLISIPNRSIPMFVHLFHLDTAFSVTLFQSRQKEHCQI